LYAVRWNALPDSTPKTAVPASEILEVVSGDRTPRDVTHDTLLQVQDFLNDQSKQDTTLIVVTRGATAVDDEDITDLPATGVTGLIRVAQT
ncbi:hypothetical protein ADL00_26855, partial [Streptomyces sp. AS58]|uniref:hypothetical protein n=1 Tax=Streptomyces sp. AS58 TaxID=1519489 RepID=UPI0006C09FED